MSLNSGRNLGFVIRVVDKASKPTNKIRRSFDKMDKKASKTAKKFDMVATSAAALKIGVGLLAGGLVALGSAFSAALSAGEFEQDLQRTKLIMSATAEEMQNLRDKSIESGLKTQFSPQEALQGLKDLGTLGFTAAEAIGALDGTLDFAAAAGLEMTQAATVTGATLRIFRKDADFASEAADKLLKISTLTALQAPDLEVALGNVARGASLAKQDIDEMLISVGLVKNTGVQASKAGSQVSIALLKMAQNAGALKKMGVEVTNADGSFRDFLDIVMDVKKATAGMKDEAEKAETIRKVFGRGVGAVSAIMTQLDTGVRDATGQMRKGADAVDLLRKKMGAAKGTAKEFRDAVLNTLPGQITLIKGMWETLKLEVGTGLAQILKPIAVAARDMFDRLIKGYKELSPGLRDFLGKGVLIGGVLAVLSGGFLVLVGSIMAVIPLISAAVSGLAAAAPVILTVGAALAAVVALFYAFKAAYDRNIGGFGDSVRSIVEKVSLLFTGLFQLITDGFISGDTAKKLKSKEHAGILHFLALAYKWGFRVAAFFKELGVQFESFLRSMRPAFEGFNKAMDGVQDVMADIVGMFDRLTPSMEQTGGAASFLMNILGSVFSVVVNVATALMSFFKGVFATMEPIIRPVIDKVVKSFTGVKDAIVELMTELGLLGDGTSTNAEAFEALGMVFGIIMDVALMPIVAAFEMIMVVVRLVTKVITGVVKVFKESFGAIGIVIDGFVKLFSGDLVGAMEDFDKAWDKVWASVADIFVDIFFELKKIFDEMLVFIAETILAIPDQFRPKKLGDWAEGQLALSQEDADKAEASIAKSEAEIDAKESMAQSFAGFAQDSYSVGYKNNTGSAESKGDRPVSEDAFARILEEADEQVNGPKELRAVINIGNEKVGEVVSVFKRSATALGFGSLVDSEDG